MEALWPTTGPAKNLIDFALRAANNPNTDFGAEITIATYRRGSESASNDFVRACEESGLGVHIIHERFLFDPAVIPAIQKLIDRCKPDIVQSHAVKSHFLIRLAAIHKDRPWIAFHHGYTWTSSRTRIYNHLDRWSLRAARKVVTVCQPFASTLKEIGIQPERIVVRHNSVKTFSPASDGVVTELRKNLGISREMQVILCAGRLSREKAQADLIKAASLMKRENFQNKLCFVVAGDGPDGPMLKEMARSLGVEGRFIFAGQIADLKPYYTLANLVVLPSHSEGSPNVLLEAMAAGLPIIATSVGGIPEIVENEKQALLVEKQNPRALAEAMERLLNNADLRKRLAEASQQTVSAYSPTAYCDSILSLYKECLADRNPRASDYTSTKDF